MKSSIGNNYGYISLAVKEEAEGGETAHAWSLTFRNLPLPPEPYFSHLEIDI